MRTCFGEIVHQYQHFKLNHKSDKFFCTLALRFLNHRDFRVVTIENGLQYHSSSACHSLIAADL